MTVKPELIRLARLLTGSHDRSELLAIAKKLEQFENASEIANTYKHPILSETQADIVEFAQTLSIMHPILGPVPFELYNYQLEGLTYLSESEERQIAIASGRQMGWSTLLAAFMLHYAATNEDSTQLLVAPSLQNAIDVAERVRVMLESRADIGVDSASKNKIWLSNGSHISFSAARSEALCGMSLDKIVFMDAAYINPAQLNAMLVAALPALVGKTGQIIMQSTPNVANDRFHNFCKSAGLYIHQPWYEHPLRDANWKNYHVAALGQDRFDREFEAKFI